VSLKDSKIATANSVDSDAYVDGSIDTAHIDALQVTGAKLNTDVISAQTELAVAPADTDEFMVSDAGVLKRIDYSLIKGGGNYSVHAFGQYDDGDQVNSTTTGRVVITDQDFTFTPTSTSDIFTFFGHCLCYISASAGAGLILTYSTDDFANITEGFNQGDGSNHVNASDEPVQQNIYIECKVTGLTADTAYKFRLYAQQLTTDNTYYNYSSGTPASAQAEHSLMGIHYKYEG
jgi:hypothetical protein